MLGNASQINIHIIKPWNRTKDIHGFLVSIENKQKYKKLSSDSFVVYLRRGTERKMRRRGKKD